jgi:SNF2 family DNA or RNA helicase
MAQISRDYTLQAVGTPLTIWETVFAQLFEAAGKVAPATSGELCGEHLYGAEPKPRRYSLAKWMARRLPPSWWRDTGLVIDEAHEMSNGETAQSLAGQRLAGRARFTMLLTGSIMGGYARSLFHVLRMASPEFRAEWKHGDIERFCSAYGYSKFTATEGVERASRRGRQSDRHTSDNLRRTGDAPGVAPAAVLRHVLPVAAVVHQEDLELSIPPMVEREVQVPLDERDADMLDVWAHIETRLLEAMQDFSIRKKLLWAMMKLPTYPDLGCQDVDPFVIQMPVDRDDPDAPRPIIVDARLQPASYLTPKERWLLDFLPAEREQGRRTLVFVTHTGGGYPARLQCVLRAAGVTCAYLDVKKVKAADRDEWIRAECSEVEVLICNPNAVRTGLNSLVAFSNAVWLEADYDARTYRQANGRIHRIGALQEARVYYLYLANSSQADAKTLIAAKVDASLRVDGLDVAGSLAMAGASDEELQAMAVYQDIAQKIYERAQARRSA